MQVLGYTVRLISSSLSTSAPGPRPSQPLDATSAIFHPTPGALLKHLGWSPLTCIGWPLNRVVPADLQRQAEVEMNRAQDRFDAERAGTSVLLPPGLRHSCQSCGRSSMLNRARLHTAKRRVLVLAHLLASLSDAWLFPVLAADTAAVIPRHVS